MLGGGSSAADGGGDEGGGKGKKKSKGKKVRAAGAHHRVDSHRRVPTRAHTPRGRRARTHVVSAACACAVRLR
eukprot:582376-Prymnesium_polylepis.1